MLPERRTPVRLQPGGFVSVFYYCIKAQIRATPRHMPFKPICGMHTTKCCLDIAARAYPTRQSRTLKYTAFSLCLCRASERITKTRRVASSSSEPAASSRVSLENVGWIVDSTLMRTRKPSISLNTSFVHASCNIILCISDNTYIIMVMTLHCGIRAFGQTYLYSFCQSVRRLESLRGVPHELNEDIPRKVLWVQLIRLLECFLAEARRKRRRKREPSTERREEGAKHVVNKIVRKLPESQSSESREHRCRG